MATFLLSSVESREGGHGLCHHLREKRGPGLLVLRGEGSMTMAIFFPSLVKSCRGGHGPSSEEEEVCSSSSKGEGKDGHGRLLPFLSEEP